MVKIVSDSSTLYSIQGAKNNNIDIAPLAVTINGVTYKEYEEIDTEEFIDIINEGHIPISSQPAIGEVINIYNKYPHDEIINISMADGLSGTYNSACAAKGLADNPEGIEVINSKTLCGPHRYIVDVAVKLAEMDKSKDEILKEINDLIETSQSYLIPNDFDYLVRGGRLSSLAGKIGSLIKLVPVIRLSEDRTRLEKFTTKRTFPNAIKKICEDLIKSLVDSNYKIYVAHACREDLANKAKEIILESIEGLEVEIKKLGPVFTTQGGPGCIAIQVIKKHSILG
ncbi:DegV family protein [Clostridium gasigenes]|uniref:EDD domain protein, DegV family n=1 Tax=Clostridium gasigenes TaxID=94869 RepID=A0A1H0UK28_9CLOT|nr:DegV family protein [Clostridium gasigenes]MBB6623175.1 DegV family protein [Clostridium gasigenes]MBU3087941.1 DegV family protein [Clostridium gasigenes]MBU3132656.1 DegV family protein [Clostridium gasigenes]NKF05815.1 DegV family protein [Clostridium gasigenes]QSW19452.1 DegV family protein [Clostridium gasigenes]